MLKIIINGYNGKMGQVLAATASQHPDVEIVAGIDKNTENQNISFPVLENINEFKDKADVVIDFSRPDAVFPLAQYAKDTGTALVIATTGHEQKHLDLMRETSAYTPVFHSANMALGVNLAKNLCGTAAQVLEDNFDIEIIEFHHNRKVDAPSGTALLLANAINEQLTNKKDYIYGRSPETGKREKTELAIHAIRGGTMPGEHRVIFSGPDEIVEIKHLALSRTIFAQGALKAARFIVQQKNGLFSMDDLIKK